MNLQKQDYINTFDKGEETSYGKSNRSNALYEEFGVRIKKQNGSTLRTDMERMECTQALSMEVLRTGMRSILREDTTMAD